MSTYLPSNSKTAFLPTSEVFPEDKSQFLVKLTSLYTDVANAVNLREIAQYDLAEFITGEQWGVTGSAQQKKSTFRKVFYFDDGSLNFAHNITGIVLCTHIYGTGTDGTNFFPIPYVDVTNVNNQIMVVVTPTNVVITKGAGAPPAITNGVIVLEYLKN